MAKGPPEVRGCAVDRIQKKAALGGADLFVPALATVGCGALLTIFRLAQGLCPIRSNARLNEGHVG